MKTQLKDIFLVAMFAGFGGIAGLLAKRGEKDKLTIARIGAELIIAVFAGTLIHYILLESGVPVNIRIAAISLAGYSARGVLQLVNAIFLKRLEKLKIVLLAIAVAVTLAAGCVESAHTHLEETGEVHMEQIR